MGKSVSCYQKKKKRMGDVIMGNRIWMDNRNWEQLIRLLGIILMLLTSGERRCLQIFKSFAEKTFIPQIKQANGSLAEWNIFESLISAPNINLNQIQFFVESLAPAQPTKSDKAPMSKKQQEIEQIAKQIFQLNKTFGGQKNRSSVANLLQQNATQGRRESVFDQMQRQQRNQSSNQNNSGILSGLQKMLRGFEENQLLFESLAQQSQNPYSKPCRPVLNQLSYNAGSTGSPPPGHATQPNVYSVSQVVKPMQGGYLRTLN